MACFDSRGFCDWSEAGSEGEEGMDAWAWKRPGEVGVP